jgi:hypothetical protein
MSQNFDVVEADPKDLEGISLLLEQRSLHPDKKLWQQYCETMVLSELQRTAGAVPKETSLIVIDRIGVVRGLCIVRERGHPNYPRLLDVPVIAIEKGPNENQIARAFFDHLLSFARCQNFDALRFGANTSKFWAEQNVLDGDARLTGTIMPLNMNRQRLGELSKLSSAGSPSLQRSGGHSFDQSRLYRTDVICSPPWYARALA